MKQTINFSQFCDAFRDADRNDQFSYKGKELLFDWFEQYDDEAGTETELDVIAICCDFYEENPADIAENYGIDISDLDSDKEKTEAIEEYLNNHTLYIGDTGDTLVYAAF